MRQNESEMRFALLIERAEAVFGGKEKAERWLSKLGGLSPRDKATKENFSIEQVENLL